MIKPLKPLLLHPLALALTFDAIPNPLAFAVEVVLNPFHEASDEAAVFERL